jgi:hypothetical protein
MPIINFRLTEEEKEAFSKVCASNSRSQIDQFRYWLRMASECNSRRDDEVVEPADDELSVD